MKQSYGFKKIERIVIMILAALFVGMFGTSSMNFAGGLTPGKGKMTGVVTDAETGKPLEGVTVKVFSVEMDAFLTPAPVTDAEGKWKALFLRSGRWDLDFTKVGYETMKISYVVAATPGAPIEVKMRKSEGTGASQEIVKEIEVAKTLMAEKNIDKAVEELLKIKEKFKTENGVEIVDLYIGNCHSMKGEYPKAIESYKVALTKYPQNKELIISIGNAYTNLNDTDNAMVWFNKLSIDDIGNIDTLYNMGVVYYNKSNLDLALKYFLKSVEIDPNFADGFYQVGMTYTALSKSKEAIEALKKFMQLAPDSQNFEAAKAVVDAFGGK